MSELLVGAHIAGHRVLRELGRGGMGVVYLVEPLASPGARLALKLLLRTDAKASERLRREGALLARIDHPNVVRVHGTGEDRGRVFIVLDFVDGESLETKVARGALAWRSALELLEPVARALEAVHALGIVHRDLKPANILVGRDDRARLTDFGIAAAEDLERLTRTGALVGTGDYLAPEQLRGQCDPDPASDIYSFGLCLYEALAGRRPFVASTLLDLAHKVENERVPPPSRFAKELPARLDRLVLRMLARDPAARPASPADIADELLEVLAGKKGARASVLPLLGGLLLVGAAATVAVVARRAAQEPAPDPTLAAYEDELARSARELADGHRDLARKRAAAVAAALEASTEPRHRDLLARARTIEAASQPRSATPAKSQAATLRAKKAIERARAARGTDNPKGLHALDSHAALARHAEQVYELLVDARRQDPEVELPADLLAFVADTAVVVARKRDFAVAFPLLEKAVELDPLNVQTRLDAAYYFHPFEKEQRKRTLEHSLAVLANTRATREQHGRALGLAIQAAGAIEDHATVHRLLEQGLKESPDSPSLLGQLCEEQLRTKDPAALATAEHLLALPGEADEKRGRRRFRARANLFCRNDPGAALAELREIRGSADFNTNDEIDDLIIAAKAYVLLGDKAATRRLILIARKVLDLRPGSPAPRVALDSLATEADALPDRN